MRFASRLFPISTLSLLALMAADGTWTFRTGEPVMEGKGGMAFPMDAEQYARFVEQVSKMPNHVAVRKKPAGASASARYGYNFVVDGKNRGWMLDGDAERGWVLYLDLRGDGDLSQAEARRLERVDGEERVEVEIQGADGTRWPVRFEVTSTVTEGKKQLAVAINDSTVRSGVVELGGMKYPFRLRGSHGKYDDKYDTVAVDRGNGKFDRYKATDGVMNLGGKTYRFAVDGAGASLTLTESREVVADRPSLRAGSEAPSFVAASIDRKDIELAAYRGRLLLIEFWSTLCGPCRAEAPRMAEFYRKTARDRIEFLGISSDEDGENLTAFLKEHGLGWPQIREPFEGPLHKTYRVEGEPTYFLVGKKGEILDTWLGSGETTARVGKFLERSGAR